jgi:malonyl-CoA O-methyltransferase
MGAESESRSRVVLPTREGYDRWSEIYDDEDNALIALEEPRVAELLGDVAGRSIADIGCGTGRHGLRLAAAGAKVTALDFSTGMISKALAKRDIGHCNESLDFVCADLAKRLPLRDGAFDCVLCCLVLDHVEHPRFLFGELRRICKIGGLIIVSVMHPAMMLRGVQARFTDPATGAQTYPQSAPNQISDYVMAALRADLRFEVMSEHAVDAALAARMVRAQRYEGWPMLLMMALRPE